MPAKSVLIMEDSNLFVRAYSKVLTEAGYKVIATHDGESGLFVAELCKPTAIILDLLMTGIDGLQVLRILRRNPATAQVPVIVISSLPRAKGEELLAEGANEYIEKAKLAPQMLAATIAKAVSNRAST